MKSIRFNLIRAFFTISLLFVSVGLFAQQAVSGTVSDSDGNPIPGVSIVEKNTTNGTVSDFDGNFQLSVGENAVLMFSYIGYITIEQNATSASMSVTLEEDVAKLDEVVVVGYGAQTKKTLTGAVGTVSAEQLTLKPAQNTSELLFGTVAGLSVRQTGALPGSDFATLRIRNFGAPLVLVDGIQATFGQVDPNDIQSISVLKDGAASIYGARAGNGVVLITTKRGSDAAEGAKFTYHGTTTWSTLTVRPETVNAHQFAQLMEEVGLGAENEMPDYLDYDPQRQRVFNSLTGEGDPFADFYIGWNLNLNVYDFDLSVTTYGSFGNDIFRGYERNLNYTNKPASILSRWTGPGTSNTEPRASFVDGNNNIRPSTRYVEDGSYFKIRNVQLGYNFNMKNSGYLDSVRLYLQGKNLMTFTDYSGFDPEMSGGVLDTGIDRGNYPSPRTVSVGLNVKF